MFRGFILPNLCGDYFIDHEIRIISFLNNQAQDSMMFFFVAQMILIVLFFERWFPRFFALIGLAFHLPKPDPKIIFVLRIWMKGVKFVESPNSNLYKGGPPTRVYISGVMGPLEVGLL